MRLFLDSTTRVFRGVAPQGTTSLSALLTTGTIEVDVSDSDWTATYYPAWLLASDAGRDLVVAVDGSTSTTAHTPTASETAQSALITFANIASPTTGDVATALKALVKGGGSTLLPSGAWGVVVWGTNHWEGSA